MQELFVLPKFLFTFIIFTMKRIKIHPVANKCYPYSRKVSTGRSLFFNFERGVAFFTRIKFFFFNDDEKGGKPEGRVNNIRIRKSGLVRDSIINCTLVNSMITKSFPFIARNSSG